MKKSFITVLGLTLALALGLTACSSGASEESTTEDGKTIVKVGVVGEYNAQWDTINELLADDGIEVELVKFTDYAAPNRALNDGEIDLNAFQHKAFLANDVQQNGYEIEAIGDTIIAPLSIYNNKDKISSVEEIKDGDIIAIPSDLTNGGYLRLSLRHSPTSFLTARRLLSTEETLLRQDLTPLMTPSSRRMLIPRQTRQHPTL